MSGLNYNLSVISEDEFTTFHTFVQAVFDEGHQWYKPKLMTVSQAWADMPEIHHATMKNSDCLGVSMADAGMAREEFHVWMSPSWEWPSFKFFMTLAHELCHGYVGLQYDHTPNWRRWFYRTLWHLNKQWMLPQPEDDLKYVCVTVEHAYNTRPKVDPMLTILEAFNKAESEHDRVLDNYFGRLAGA